MTFNRIHLVFNFSLMRFSSTTARSVSVKRPANQWPVNPRVVLAGTLRSALNLALWWSITLIPQTRAAANKSAVRQALQFQKRLTSGLHHPLLKSSLIVFGDVDCDVSMCPPLDKKCNIGYAPVLEVPEGKCCPEIKCGIAIFNPTYIFFVGFVY